MAPLRIFLCIDFYLGPNGGTERQLFLLAEGLVARGHDVRLFVLQNSAYTRTSRDFPCPVECLDIHSVVSIDTVRKMTRFRTRVRSEQPDVVHAFFNDSALLVPFFCKTPRTRIFTSRRDMGHWYTAGKLRALSFANRRADGIICNSRAVAAEARRRERVSDGKLLVIYNACPTPTHLGQGLPEQAPADTDTPRLRVCLIANLRPIKRIEDLIQATAAVRKELPGLQVRVVGGIGDDHYAEQLQGLVRKAGLTSTVTFLPQTDRPFDIIQSSDIGVLTSQSEGFSNTLMEYMAGGLPVLCSAVGGNPELVRHGIEGFLFEPGNIDELSRYMLVLARDVELRAELGRRGMERVREFSMERMVQAHCELYGGAFGDSLSGSPAAVDASAPR